RAHHLRLRGCLGLARAELPQALPARVRVHDRPRRAEPSERHAGGAGRLAANRAERTTMADDQVNIEVDGAPVKARKGEMIIRATDGAGVYVPRFCYHEKRSIAANCRMCLVEVEKAPKPLPACATPVAEAGSGFGAFSTSTRHMRQLAAIERFS